MHNDIKSKNILLTKDAAVAKISDVGTSRILETTAATLSFPMLCTYAYAAPEQLMGTRDVCTDKVSHSACLMLLHGANPGQSIIESYTRQVLIGQKFRQTSLLFSKKGSAPC